MLRYEGVAIIEEEDAKTKTKKVPPDGGWGWLVLFGATLVNVLIPGTIKSFGILLVEFLEVFRTSPATAMWIPSLCYFLYSSLGPVSSILSLKYSYRTVTLIGGTFAAVGMMCTTFAQNIIYVYITVGVFVGTGAGLAFPPTVYIVTSYFNRLRGLANGICISGSALGSIILPPLLRIILEEYGYRGTCLIIGGLILNVWVAALFYDPVEKHMKTIIIEPEDEDDKQEELIVTSTLKSVNQIDESSSVVADSMLSDTVFSEASRKFNRSASSTAMQTLRTQGTVERKISVPACMSNSTQTTERQDGTFQRLRVPKIAQPPKRSPSTSSFQYITTPYHGSALTLQPEVFASSFSLRGSQGKLNEPPKKKFIDLALLKDPIYLIIMISSGINAVSYTNFLIILPQYAIMQNFGKTNGALLLSVVSTFDLIGRIGGSALSDLQCCPKLGYYIGGLLISGLALSFLPVYPNFVYVSCCCVVFGISSGAYTGVTAVIMTDMLGEDRLQSTYGISLFFNGILQLISPPICGAVLNGPSTYVMLFIVLGIMLVCAASLWLLMPCIPDSKKHNKEKKNYVL
ncbi:monocarboxylate transporter 4 isoform X2 [Harmonia axyridis]|uniref:monocarboxylate transporter 4 isoform X2 n=1 Tax=Harmonia axyridis TaxID=115357 RepID=UPI001E2781A6|nr:monocarboxylate transporter 4 isoform X2 [Harmonia axyridis]